MRNRMKCAIGMSAFIVSLVVVAAQHGPRALGQVKGEEDHQLGPVPGPSDRPPEPQEYFDKRLLVAAKEAYEVALEEFKAERITDADVLYRWSLRWMKAEKAAGDDPVVAAKGHLRRMEGELTEVKGQLLTRKKATDDELKYFITSTRFYVYEAKELVKKAERAPLANTAANANDAASSPHDAAIAVAESYLNAVLKGDTEAAAKLAAPGSLAASKRLMESFKGLAKLESDKNPIRIGSVQDAGRGEITVTSEVELASKIATNRTLGTFTVNLRQSNGRRFLVTNIAVYQTTLFDAPARTSLLLPGGQTPILADDGVPAELRSQRGNKSARPTTKTEATTKETKVIVLKYAKAADLSQTISQLLELNNPDFRVAVDVRTNRLLLHGTPDRLKEVIPLIEELDVPSAVKEALPMIEIPKDPDVPGAVKKTEPARENLFDTLPTQPAGETKP